MCDVIGNQPTSVEKMEQVCDEITHESLETFIGERGNLPTNVKEHIKSLGYTWTDSGGGCNSWHIGVPFNSLVEACAYLEKMTTKFQHAIAAGMLNFKLSSWTREDWKP